MKTEAIALAIEIKESKNKSNRFYFNEIMLHATLSGLSTVYSEVFIWQAGKHLAVWVVGGNTDLLIQSFTHHRSHFKRIQLLGGTHAYDLMLKIAEGKTWDDCSMTDKMESFNKGYQLSTEMDCLGEILSPLLSEGDCLLRNNYYIWGSRNSWIYGDVRGTQSDSIISEKVQIPSKDLFYRFCVN